MNLSGPIGILLLIVCIPLCPFITEERKKEGERHGNRVISLPIPALERGRRLESALPLQQKEESSPTLHTNSKMTAPPAPPHISLSMLQLIIHISLARLCGLTCFPSVDEEILGRLRGAGIGAGQAETAAEISHAELEANDLSEQGASQHSSAYLPCQPV